MKEEILRLKSEGKTYNEIKEILGCSKGTISYYCGNNQKEKTLKRNSKRRENPLLNKTEKFKYRKNKVENLRKFKKTNYEVSEINNNRSIDKNLNEDFTWCDVLEKYGENTKCYLSGEDLNLYNKETQFDHIIPVSKGGNNTLDNLGISHKIPNAMKNNLSVDELLYWCAKILENNGFIINKN